MSWLWLVPTLPLAGAVFLALFGGMMPRRVVAVVGCGSVGLSWLIAIKVAAAYLGAPPGAFRQPLFQWINVATLRVPMALYLDALSLVMMAVVTFVGFVIHLYSAEHMSREEGYSRFFCYMNLFVASMLILVLADNLLSLYLGWEGVGLCSYLLIGFWYRDRRNGVAAQKAFIITRIGDALLAIGLYLLFWCCETLSIEGVMRSLHSLGSDSQALLTAAALLVLGGAVGKSAQLPLQTWLPDAMAGPTPVSALIHAATMVTAGVYLIARTHMLFSLSPTTMLVVAVIGAATACYAGVSALAQRDIKRVLAYSTISQIGYMFLALGVGAWWAAIFHFVTHAFFKALLFLSAGIVIQAQGEEHDIYKMGGLWSKLPVAAWTFLVGAASLSALPLVTAGFYSKDAILSASWLSPMGSPVLWSAGVIAALLTGIYIFRVFFVVFLGPQRIEVERRPSFLEGLVVVVLAFLAIIGGFLANVFRRLSSEMSAVGAQHAVPLLVISSITSLAGIYLGYWLFRPGAIVPTVASSSSFTKARQFFLSGWGMDWLYGHLFVRPYVFVARTNRADFVDWLYTGMAFVAVAGNRALSATQSGRVRNYATGLLLGAVLVVVLLLIGKAK